MVENFLERSHKKVRREPPLKDTDTYFQSEWKAIDEKVEVCFISVRGNNPKKLPEGLYLGTNIIPEFYRMNYDIITMEIIGEVNKMFLRSSAVEMGDDLLLDTSSIMKIYWFGIEANKTMVFSLKPILPSQVEEIIPPGQGFLIPD